MNTRQHACRSRACAILLSTVAGVACAAGVDPASAPAAASIAVGTSAQDCRDRAMPRTTRPPAPSSSSVTIGSMQITLACTTAPGRVAATDPAPSAATVTAHFSAASATSPDSSITTPLPPARPPTVAASGTPPPAGDALKDTAALIRALIPLLLAAAAVMLAYAAFVVLRAALGLDPATLQRAAAADGDLPERASFTFHRHWGGFGGASTGWVISERLVRVIVGLTLGALAAAIGMELAGRPRDATPSRPEASSPAAAASAGVARE